ncbi:MAG: flagellar biosynthesis anti-sigma factor FlgM [Dethiobacter sp.]|nr:flagellar biosynthesis anti-sigma factor FlgM [Dethiobacter sp.]
MKIDSRHTPLCWSKDAASPITRRVAEPDSPTARDAVAISPAAQMLREAMAREAMAMNEPFDAARVAELRTKVSEGQYTVDGTILATRLVAELLNPARGAK